MGNQAKRRQKNKQVQRVAQQGKEQDTKPLPMSEDYGVGEEATASFEPQSGAEGEAQEGYAPSGASEPEPQEAYEPQADSQSQGAYENPSQGGQQAQEGQNVYEQQEQYAQQDDEAWGEWDSEEGSDSSSGQMNQDLGPTDYVDHGIAENVAPNRNDMVECEYCAEQYSVTYRRCPFCDERRETGGYGMDPRHIVGFSISMALICTAGFIVVKQVLPLLSPQSSPTQPDSSQGSSTTDPSGTVLDDMVEDGMTDVPFIPDLSEQNQEPEPSLDVFVSAKVTGAAGGVRVRSGPGTTFDILATVGDGADITVLEAADDGWYQITFSATTGTQTGYMFGDYIDFGTNAPPVAGTPEVSPPVATTPEVSPPVATTPEVSPPVTTTPEVAPPVTTTPEPTTPTVTPGTIPAGAATVTGAAGGVRVRGGPGTTYEALATIYDGSDITVVGSAGDGWYQISYNSSAGRETGYIMGDFIKSN